MSATEKDHAECLPPEAYIRILKSCAREPKFRSSVYPPKKDKKGKGK
jgi:hypothetical protein